MVADRFHFHVVAKNDAVIAQLVAQHAGDDALGKGRREFRVESTVSNMRGHYCFDAVSAGVNERRQFNRLELRQRFVDNWESEMRIFVGVAVTGKVFDASNDAAVSQTLGPSPT